LIGFYDLLKQREDRQGKDSAFKLHHKTFVEKLLLEKIAADKGYHDNMLLFRTFGFQNYSSISQLMAH
jgi:hypothetical protein